MVDQYHFPIMMMVLTIIILVLVHHFKQWLDHHDLFWISMILIILIGIIFLQLEYPSIMIDDARIIEDTAMDIYTQIQNGSFHFDYFDQYYYLKYPWQVTLTLFEVVLHCLSKGNGTMIYPWINLFCVIITYICGHTLLKWLEPNRSLPRNVYGLIILIFITPLTYSSYRYGWQIGMALSAISLLLFTAYQRHSDSLNNHYIYLVASLLIWIIACLFKTNFVIIGIAYILTVFIKTWSNHLKSWPVLLLTIGLVLVGLNSNTWLYSGLIGRYEAGVPRMLYLVTGISEGSIGNGWYDDYNEVYVNVGYDPTKASEIAKADINKRISTFLEEPLSIIDFFSEKFVSTFLAKDYQSHAYFYWDQENKFNQTYENGWFRDLTYTINDLAFLWVWIGLTIIAYIAFRYFHDSTALYLAPYALSLLGASVYHMVFETKAIYIYPWVTLILPFTALGITRLIDHQWSIKPKQWLKYSWIPIGLTILLMAYNHLPMVYSIASLNYTDDQMVLPFNPNDPTTYTFTITPSSSYDLSMIEWMSNGANPVGTIALTIQTASGTILSSSTYDTSQLLAGYTWLRFVFDPVPLQANQPYTISFTPSMQQDGLGMIVGTYTPSPTVSRITQQSETIAQTNYYPNIKFYSYHHDQPSIDYLYQQSRAFATYYPMVQP